MSAELISVILVAAGLLVALGGCFFAGFAWLKRRIDERFDKLDQRFDQIHERFGKIEEQFVNVDQRFGKMARQFDTIDERTGRRQAELNEAKAAGPPEGAHERPAFPRLSPVCSANRQSPPGAHFPKMGCNGPTRRSQH